LTIHKIYAMLFLSKGVYMRLHKISKYFNFRLKDLRYGDVKEITIEIESDAKVIGFKGSENEFELTYCSSTEDTFERKIFIMDEHSTEELSDVSFIGKITCENCCGSETDFYFFFERRKRRNRS